MKASLEKLITNPEEERKDYKTIRVNHGGRFKKKEDGKWVEDPSKRCNDLQSLILNIVLTKVTQSLSLKARLLMSEDGTTIYMVIRADDADIMDGAETFKQVVQMEIGNTDLSSLQPCDKMLRPYYILKSPDPEISELESQLQQYFKHTRFSKSQELVKESNPKLKADKHWAYYKSI